MQRISPCLWFDTQAEQAAKFYTSIFPNSKIRKVTHYTDAGPRPQNMVMTVDFELNGERFTALNGGPEFKFNEAVSLMVSCKTQEEIDNYWSDLLEGGQELECGWLKDRFGVTWQIVPTVLEELIDDDEPERSSRVMAALLKMKKLDIAELKHAAEATASVSTSGTSR